MSKVADLLRAKRAAQIAKMEGRTPERTDKEFDEELEGLREKKPAPSKRRYRSEGLHLTRHARQRMGQRRMTIKQVYALWMYGERRPLREKRRTVHLCSEQALREMPLFFRNLLLPLRGGGIIVEEAPPDEPNKRPSVVTVVADGEATRFR